MLTLKSCIFSRTSKVALTLVFFLRNGLAFVAVAKKNCFVKLGTKIYCYAACSDSPEETDCIYECLVLRERDECLECVKWDDKERKPEFDHWLIYDEVSWFKIDFCHFLQILITLITKTTINLKRIKFNYFNVEVFILFQFKSKFKEFSGSRFPVTLWIAVSVWYQKAKSRFFVS